MKFYSQLLIDQEAWQYSSLLSPLVCLAAAKCEVNPVANKILH